ncbi:MAG: helix-turn-helix transcriptional regulator [Deltaproteobacteria bacterium]|nr:helix-turn-helix transcriptional regulator [Deltaproteobacteria bacterium]
MLSEESDLVLNNLGARLKSARLDRNESQARFAARLGISIPTLRNMEKGDPAVRIGLWVEALWILDHLGDLKSVLKKQESLFDQFDKEKTVKMRRRASGKRNQI